MPSNEVELATPIQPADMKKLREAFAEFDKDSDGHITKEELVGVMANFNHVITPNDVDDVIKMVDKDGNGVLDFEEFLDLMDGNCLVHSADTEMKCLFNMFDTDRDGYITEKEISTVMKNLGEKVRKKDLRKMIKEADKNKDGKISFPEFKNMVDSGNFLGGAM